MNLGENIHTYRTQQNLSQGELANMLDVSRQSVSKWENNLALPELDKLIRMSKLFSISLDELVYGPQPMQQTNNASTLPFSILPQPRVLLGSLFLFFGMIFFLLSMFWGNHLSFGEEIGELISIGVVLLSIAMLATYNHKVLAGCAVFYFVYAITCIGIVNVVDIPNYIFMSYASIVLFIWFIKWGYNARRKIGEQP